MKTNPIPKSIYTVLQQKQKIDPRPQYQRGAVWTEEKQSLLIDSILRGYDIPKIYLREIEHQKYEYEVVDGQQRLLTIWSFANDEFPLGKHSNDLGPYGDLSGKFYSELPTDLQVEFGSFTLTVTEIRSAKEFEIRDLFLRLQNGSSLSPAEKRNAVISNIRDFIHELSSLDIMNKTTIKNNRFQYDDYLAHVVAYEINQGPCNVKAADLMKLYEKNKDFNVSSVTAKKVRKTLNLMNQSFNNSTPELRIKWGFFDLYVLISHISEKYFIKDLHNKIKEFYLDFERRRSKVSDVKELLNGDIWDKDLYDYIEAFRREGAIRSNITTRKDVYLKRFLFENPDLLAKDEKRAFNTHERTILYRKSNGICLNCNKQIEFNAMHADHIIPHSKGGRTTLLNGQCLCSDCNLKKGNKK